MSNKQKQNKMKNSTIKTTAREYKNSYELLRQAKNEIDNLRRADKITELVELEKEIKKFEAKYFDRLPTVLVSFCIGSRNYYREVVKLGKSYFQHGRSMTKSNGHYCITEIDEITDKMSEEMLADSYYY